LCLIRDNVQDDIGVNFSMDLANFIKNFKTGKGDSVIIKIGIEFGIVDRAGKNLRQLFSNAMVMKSNSKPSFAHFTEAAHNQIKQKLTFIGPELSNFNKTTASYSIKL
jgi:hypothetical protein